MENEKDNKNKSLTLGIKILLLAANIFVLWLFIPLKPILYTTLVILIISLFFLITGSIQSLLNRKKRIVKVSPVARVLDTMGFARRYIRLNLRFTLLTTLGLMIAIATLSQAFIVAQGVQQDYLYQKVNPDTIPTLSVTTTISPYVDLTKDMPSNSTNYIIDSINKFVNDASPLFGFSRPKRSLSIIKTTGIEVLVNGSLVPVTLIGVNKEVARDLWGNSISNSLSKNASRFSVVIYPQAFGGKSLNISDNQDYTLYFKYSYVNGSIQNSIYIQQKFEAINVKIMPSDGITLELPHNFGFVGGINLIYDISIFDTVRAKFAYGISSTLISSYYHDWDVFDATESAKKMRELADYILFNNKFVTKGIAYYHISQSVSPVGGIVLTISEFLTAVKFIMLIFIIPMIGGALFLVLYSFGLIENRKRKFIAILKSRGASSSQVATSLSLEILYSAILGFILGILLSYVSVPFMHRVLGIHSAITINQLYLTSKSTLLPIGVFALVVSYDLNLNEILSLSPLSITEAEEPSEQEVSGWKKYYVDIFMLLIGLLALLILEVLKSRPPSAIQTILMLVISPFALLGLSLGSVLAVSRFFGSIAKSVGDWGWIKFGNLPSFSLKNLNLRKESAAGLASVLLLTSLIGIFLVIVPFSLNAGAQRQLLYNLGGEIQVSQLANWNASDFSFLHGNEGYQAVTGVYMVEFEMYLSTGGESQTIRFLGINTTTFLKAAYLDPSFLNFDIKELSSRLQGSDVEHRVFPALIWTHDGAEKLLKEGRSQTFSISDKHSVTLRKDFIFKITGQFEYWPLLIDSVDQPSGYRFVVPLEAIHSLLDVIMPTALDISDGYLIAKPKPNVPIDTVAKNLLNSVSVKFSTPKVETITSTTQSQGSQAVLATVPKIVKMGYIVMLIQALVAVAMFASLTIGARKREIGLYKALGMLRNQLFTMFLTEILYILIFSLSLGTIFGVFTSKTVLSVLSLPGLAGGLPPYPSIIPYIEILKLLGAFIIAGLLAAAWPAQKLASEKAGDIMKVE